MVKRIILIRPGETDWNRWGRWQGWVAAPLNEHGRQQAQRLAKFVRNIGMSALYSSDLRRAAETAELLAEKLGYRPIFDARWRERNIGNWQGLTVKEMRSWYPDEYQHLTADRTGFHVPGGESLNEVLARTREAFKDILAQNKGETVGILSHTTAINMLLADLIPSYTIGSEEFDNTSVTTILHADSGEWQLVAANDVMHLEGLASSSVKELE